MRGQLNAVQHVFSTITQPTARATAKTRSNFFCLAVAPACSGKMDPRRKAFRADTKHPPRTEGGAFRPQTGGLP